MGESEDCPHTSGSSPLYPDSGVQRTYQDGFVEEALASYFDMDMFESMKAIDIS